ncbi:MAG: hypothetical protein VCA12_18325 [Pseudomonadales bacterium]
MITKSEAVIAISLQINDSAILAFEDLSAVLHLLLDQAVDEVVQQIGKAGLRLRERRILMVDDPASYKWDSIHVSAFRKE